MHVAQQISWRKKIQEYDVNSNYDQIWEAMWSNIPTKCAFFSQLTECACNYHMLQEEMQSASKITCNHFYHKIHW